MTRFTCFTAVVLLCMPFAVGKNNNLTLEQTVTLCNALKQFRGLKDAVRDLKYWITTESLKISNAKTRSDEYVTLAEDVLWENRNATDPVERAKRVASNVTEAAKKAETASIETEFRAENIEEIRSNRVAALERMLKEVAGHNSNWRVRSAAEKCKGAAESVSSDSLNGTLLELFSTLPEGASKGLEDDTRESSGELWKLEFVLYNVVTWRSVALKGESTVKELVEGTKASITRKYNLTLNQTQAVCLMVEQYRGLKGAVDAFTEQAVSRSAMVSKVEERSQANAKRPGGHMDQVKRAVAEVAKAANKAQNVFKKVSSYARNLKSIRAHYLPLMENTLRKIAGNAADEKAKKAAEVCGETAWVVTPKSLDDMRKKLMDNFPNLSERLESDTRVVSHMLEDLNTSTQLITIASIAVRRKEVKLNKTMEVAGVASLIEFGEGRLSSMGSAANNKNHNLRLLLFSLTFTLVGLL
ncbi:T. brucei spp.-specific protein [Trypanosoma brucei gambiense DAL972]|uniref:T. brucei spp.-specific protein n=1 Tax=Trypanosoma brucei gambiense (strain MHOM/CI/86/DAL972) TaxID=679716 RepID=C9ZUL3_TRYB9|nr:T. brucei spp.-specific protein [Trypanosoma brucei gambiense DAL972]CBH13101.1 T. brucei spp.-specific protein [Trypanosoma brucei gambiense DAL972]|eukprot:XP_011775378.1 T. brucei spp.-specific protein [Trypanosoma brucei gambiense DAL972]